MLGVISYILIALSVCHVTVMLSVLHFLWQNRPLYITAPGWLTAGECSSECIREGILTHGKNGRNSRGEFPPTTRHREKWWSEHRSTTVGWRAFDEEKNERNSKKRMGVSPSVFVSPLCLPSALTRERIHWWEVHYICDGARVRHRPGPTLIGGRNFLFPVCGQSYWRKLG